LSTDGYNFLAAVNYTHNNELSATQRPFSATGFNPSKGLQNNNGPQGPFPGGYYDANNNLFQVGAPGCAGNPYLARVNGAPFNGYCAYEYSAAVDLIPKSSELSGLLSLSKTLPANNTLSLQYFYTLSKVTPWSGPEEYAGLTMNPSSPFYPTAGESTCVGCSASPALGGPISVGWTDPNNNRYFEDQNTEQRLLLTLTGDNLGWDYLVAGNYSRNHNINSAEAGFPNISVWAPGNVLSNLINPFGPQTAAGQALINSSYTNGVLETGELSLASLNGHVSHKLGDWFGAGHPSTIAVGFDIRDEHISYNPTSLAATLYSATFFAPIVITGGRREQAIYAELNVPVFKQFEFTVSDREDKYSDFGNTNNAKLALRYQPIEILTLRGAASTGFRAPSLVDLYSPQVLGAVAGTMLGPGCPAGSGPVFTASNCAAQGMGVYGGNPKLGPEKSDNIDLGFVLEPIKDLGITVDYYRITVKNEIQTIPAAAIYASPSVFGSDYSLNNAGTLTQAPSAPTACVNGPSTPSCGYIFLTTENTGGIRTSGFDLSANYLLRTAVGKVRVGLDGTLVTNYQLQEYEGAPWITLARQFNQGNQPIIGWQHLLTVDWTQGDWAAGLSNHYLSSYTDMYTASGQLWVGQGSGGSTVSSYSTWNAYGSWRPIKPLTVLVGVRNVFDTQPSFSNQTQNWQAGYNPLFSDPTGRAFYTKLKYVF
jgi:iron complex outermembrane receptor protein